MVVGQNRPISIDDKAGAQAPLTLRAPRHRTAKKTLPKIIKRIILAERAPKLLLAASLADLRSGNINDHRSHLLRERDKIRQFTGRSQLGISRLAEQIYGSTGRQPIETAANSQANDQRN